MRFDRVLGLAGRTLLAMTIGTLVVVACGPSTPAPPPDDAIEIDITTVGPGIVRQSSSDFVCRGSCTWTGAPEDASGFVAVPDGANAFVAWSGACDTLDATCTRLLSDGDATTATFAPHALRLFLTGDGEGEFRIQGPAVDIGCTGDCAVGVTQPLSLAITYFAHGSSETVLEDWGGACSGADRLDYCLAPVNGATDVDKIWRRPPVAVDDTFATTRNAPLTVDATAGVLANDSDTPGDTLTVVLVTDAARGALDLAADGGFDYTPDPGTTGVDAFAYRIRDAFGNLSNTATATITVTNRPPEAVGNSYVTELNAPLTVPAPGVLANDRDPDGDALTIVAPTPVSDGTLVLEPDGGFTYTPEPDFIGLATFAYSVSDGLATSDAATVTIGVGLDAPVASDDAYATFRNQDLVVEEDAGVLANDVDPAEEPLVAVLVDDVAEGTLVLAADGGFTYQPDAGFVGTDAFTYVASNGEDISVVATVTIEVTNRPPVANPDTYSMFRNGTLTTTTANDVLTNDTDPDGDPLTAVLITPPASGTLTLNPNGTFTYTPPTGFTGPATFTYAANDDLTNGNTTTVTITVSNRPPTAVNDGPYGTFRNQPLTVPAATGLLDNDTDPDGDTLTVTATTQPTGGAGSVTVNPNGSFTYTPTTGYTGTTTFTYTANDGLTTDTATATITVGP